MSLGHKAHKDSLARRAQQGRVVQPALWVLKEPRVLKVSKVLPELLVHKAFKVSPDLWAPQVPKALRVSPALLDLQVLREFVELRDPKGCKVLKVSRVRSDLPVLLGQRVLTGVLFLP